MLVGGASNLPIDFMPDGMRSEVKGNSGLNFCPIRTFISRRLTAIFERKIEPELWTKVVETLPLGVLNTKIGTQLATGSSDNRDKSGKLKQRTDSDGGTQKYGDLIIKRLIFAVLFVIGGFFVALNAPDDERRLLGAAVITGGWLLAALGLGLLWATGFSATLGWPV
jgi:hypothetical protein